MFTKKRMLSLAACTLLCGSVYASSNTKYVPLTNASYDDSWVLFGVNGFTDGVSSSGGGGAFSTSNNFSETDASDDAATWGLATSGAGTELASIQALNSATNALSELEVNVDISNITYSSTEPVRTMYIDSTGDGEIDIKFEYKTSLEGKTLEMKINSGTDIYYTTINELNTWSNPATVTTATSTTGNELIAVSDVIDYDFSNNPTSESSYDKDVHKDSATASTDARFYNYDSVNKIWKLHDIDNSTAGNDFSDFEKGKAYWGKIDHGGAGNNAVAKAGVVLGTSGQTQTADETVYAGNLADGWNLVSLDSVQPKIICAPTGLVIDVTGLAATDEIMIADSTGTHKVDIVFAAADVASEQATAMKINKTIEAAKYNGTLPKDFSVKAFMSGGDEITLISNEKFSLYDNNIAGTANDGHLNAVRTLAGGNVWDIATSTLVDYDLTGTPELPNTGVSSVYGESSLVIEPLIGVDTAAELDFDVQTEQGDTAGTARSAAIQINGGDKIFLAADDTTSAGNLATVTANIIADEAFDGTDGTGTVTELDLDFDGITESLLLSSDTPFYIKDHTFVRAHTFDGTDLTAGTYTVSTSANNQANAVDSAIAADNTATIDEAITAINDVTDIAAATTDTAVYAYKDGTKILTVSAYDPYFKLQDENSGTVEFLQDTTSSHAVAKGAVSNVFTLSTIAEKSLTTNKWKMTGFSLPDDATDSITVSINGAGAVDIDASDANDAPTAEPDTANKLLWFDDLIAEINTQIAADASILYGRATHNYTTSANQLFSSVEVIIEGMDLDGTANPVIALVVGGGAAESLPTVSDENTNDGTVAGLTSGDLTTDLKYNPIYTPSYVQDGPLYALKRAGFDPKAILTGTTKLNDSSVAWTNIDLTRSKSEWFENNEYNLFNVSNYEGYWVYLESGYTSPAITITNPSYSPTYTYSFNTDDSVVNNLIAGQFTVEVSGLSSSDKVTATVKGNTLDLIKQGTNYTGLITKYEVDGVSQGTDVDVTVTATNGLGDISTESAIHTIDYTQPDAPTVTIAQGIPTIVSASTDVAAYYAFDTNIPEASTSNSALDLSTYNMCKETTYGTTTTFKAVAVDGSGTIGSANISDALSFEYENVLNGAYVLTHTEGSDATATGDMYDSSCVATVDTNNYGVAVKSMDSGKTVVMSFIPDEEVAFTTDLPITNYFSIGGTTVVQIKHVPAYGTNKFYIQKDGVVYYGNFSASDNNEVSATALTALTSETQTF